MHAGCRMRAIAHGMARGGEQQVGALLHEAAQRDASTTSILQLTEVSLQTCAAPFTRPNARRGTRQRQLQWQAGSDAR